MLEGCGASDKTQVSTVEFENAKEETVGAATSASAPEDAGNTETVEKSEDSAAAADEAEIKTGIDGLEGESDYLSGELTYEELIDRF